MKKSLLLASLLIFQIALFSNANAADAYAGEEKIAFCERCHGIKGMTDNPNMPILAGQNKGYLIKQLKNFRKGFRKSAPMRQAMVTISDEDIELLATYYSSIKISIDN